MILQFASFIFMILIMGRLSSLEMIRKLIQKSPKSLKSNINDLQSM